MNITIQRQSGLFTEQLSDKINQMSQDLYEDISKIKSPDLQMKETVSNLRVSSTYNIVDQSFTVGRVHFINLKVLSSIKTTNTTTGRLTFTKLGSVPYAPVTDIITMAIQDKKQMMIKLLAGSHDIEVSTLGDTIEGISIYFYYIS